MFIGLARHTLRGPSFTIHTYYLQFTNIHSDIFTVFTHLHALSCLVLLIRFGPGYFDFDPFVLWGFCATKCVALGNFKFDMSLLI